MPSTIADKLSKAASSAASQVGKAASSASSGITAAANKVADKVADKVLDAKKAVKTQGKFSGEVKKEFNSKGKHGNIAAHANFSCPYEITDPDPAGWAAQLTQCANAFLTKEFATLDKAIQDRDEKLEKLKKENKAEEAQKLSRSYDAEVKQLIEKTKEGLQQEIGDWWVKNKKKQRELLKYQAAIAGKATVVIGVAALGAGAGVASAVVSGGGAAPIAAAAVSGAVSLTTTSVTQLQAALKGFHDAYVKLDVAYHKAKIEAEKQKLLGPASSGLKERILAFVKTNPMRELEAALNLYVVMVAKANEKLAGFMTQGTKLADKCEAMVKEAETSKDPKKKQEAQKAVEGLRANLPEIRRLGS